MGGRHSLPNLAPPSVVACTCKCASDASSADVTSTSGWERTQALQALAHLDRDCHRYYSQNLRPLVQRLAWMDLFPERSTAASRREWERMAREVRRLDRDRRQNHRPCSERDWDALQSVWTRILQRCPYEDIVRQQYEPEPPTTNDPDTGVEPSPPLAMPHVDDGSVLFPPPPRPRYVRFRENEWETDPAPRRHRHRRWLL